ncbi:efflux RND transporter periplasmic adaptor subunit [Persicobacter diffluens]|uniref:Acriflavin resistance protein n=1 Tax=Persicobacter diffluens TaxID=981 RepID=A0AAN4W476_9BACT|nr:acriflavin resistance protein [Persicobacter diffluens]
MRALLFTLLSLLFCCNSKPVEVKEQQSIAVKTTIISKQKVLRKINLSGAIKVESERRLSFLVPGKIHELSLSAGDHFEKGQRLALLKQDEYKEGLRVAKRKLDQANSEYERLKNMYDRQSLTESDFQKIKTLKAEAEANLVVQKNQLQYTEIIAPYPGMVKRVLFNSGEAVKEGIPVMTIIPITGLSLQFNVPEARIGDLRQGMLINYKVPDRSDSLYLARINKIFPTADPLSRTFKVEATLESKERGIKPGMVAQVMISQGEQAPQIVVPVEYIVPDEKGDRFVFLVKKGKAFRQRIVGEELSGLGLVVEKGLQEGDSLIIAGQWKLHDGATLNVLSHESH